MIPEFKPFQKIPRLSRDCIITEKIDGTNGVIYIDGDNIYAGSRNRWLTEDSDNFGFAKWVNQNKDCLLQLGPGYHYGEWYGQGIQRGYGLQEKRFALFNVSKWADFRPECCDVVPTLYKGPFKTENIELTIDMLRVNGSYAVNGFIRPEGIIIYHIAAGILFKKTLENDEKPKVSKEER